MMIYRCIAIAGCSIALLGLLYSFFRTVDNGGLNADMGQLRLVGYGILFVLSAGLDALGRVAFGIERSKGS